MSKVYFITGTSSRPGARQQAMNGGAASQGWRIYEQKIYRQTVEARSRRNQRNRHGGANRQRGF